MVIDNKEKVFLRIIIFLVLFLSGGFLVVNDIISNDLTKALWLFILGVMILKTANKLNLVFFISLILSANILMTTIYRDENLFNAVSYSIGIITVSLIIICYDFKIFAEEYINVLKFLCIFSLVATIIYAIIPETKDLFNVNNVNGRAYSTLFFFVYNTKASGIFARNYGMFWEPGAYQTFISFALLFEISKEKIDYKNIFIFVASIVTTYSTTGFFVLFFIIVYSYLKRGRESIKQKAIITFFVMCLVLFMYNYQDLFFGRGNYSTFGKIFEFYDMGPKNDRVTSVSIRRDAIIKPITLFLESPFLGLGNNGIVDRLMKYTIGVNTCTFVNWFAIYGIVFGVVMMKGVINFSKLFSRNKMIVLLVILIILCNIISENYTNNPAVIMVILYGFRKVNNQNQQIDKGGGYIEEISAN